MLLLFSLKWTSHQGTREMLKNLAGHTRKRKWGCTHYMWTYSVAVVRSVVNLKILLPVQDKESFTIKISFVNLQLSLTIRKQKKRCLTHFLSMFLFHIPWKNSETFDFLMFWGGITFARNDLNVRIFSKPNSWYC